MKTHLSHSIEKTEFETQYDENVKDVLSDKQVLARIAKYRTEEFKDYDISDIMSCIEGEPEVSKIPVYPGKRKDSITGMNTESKISDEGEVFFDVRFHMFTKDEKRIKIIVNIEAQKEYYRKYHFEPRAVFYCTRMISERLDREFTSNDYGGLKKVYSIWIFFQAPERDSDTITEYYIEKKDVYGKPVKSRKYDYLSISFIRLSMGKRGNTKHQLIIMLDTLFSEELSAESKKKLLETEHQMEMTRKLEGGIDTMFNVSLGIRERALEEGIEKGKLSAYLEMIKDGILTIPEVARRLQISEENLKESLKKGITE